MKEAKKAVKTHYEVLGVGTGASPDEIRAAYKAQIRRFHPDVYEGPAQEATERTIELNGAYAVLSDPERRAIYDRMLQPKTQEEPKAARRAAPSPYAPQETWAVPQNFRREEGWTAFAEQWIDRPAPDWYDSNGRYETPEELWIPPPDDPPDEAQQSAAHRPLSGKEEWAAYADQWASLSEQRTDTSLTSLLFLLIYGVVFIVLAADLILMWMLAMRRGTETVGGWAGLLLIPHAALGPILFARFVKGGKTEAIQGGIYLAVITLITGLLVAFS